MKINMGQFIIVFFLIVMITAIVDGIAQGNKIYNEKVQCKTKGGTYYGGIMDGGCSPYTDCVKGGNLFCKCVTGCYIKSKQNKDS